MKPRYEIDRTALCMSLAFAGQAFAGSVMVTPTAVPTLGEWGLAGIAAVLALVAGRALYRRRH